MDSSTSASDAARRTASTHGQQGQANPTTAKLTLADGLEVEGISFGAATSAAGELVFSTGMVGYPDALTDPSYRGQILVLTYPLIGNYGVPSFQDCDKHGLPVNFESDKIHIAGLIVAEYSHEYSHWNAVMSLSEWLVQSGVPAVYGVDTRMLTKRIRDAGAMLGKIEFEGQPIEFSNPDERDLGAEVSVKEVRVYNQGSTPRVVAFDCGIKYNILRYFVDIHAVEFTLVPYNYDLEKNPSNVVYDGIFVANGPGNPTMYQPTIKSLQWAMALEPPVPIFGICMGNQLLALAAGARTYKMKYGNRGMNQPCVDMRTTKCYITAQNHGYAVDSETLPKDWNTFFLNANDMSNEGIVHSTKPFCSVQFHPEAAGGPMDTAFLFEDFVCQLQGSPYRLKLTEPTMYNRATIKTVMIVGSGGLSIGQAGEFDYSGSQAIKALKEEGIRVVLINPNIATVQTSKNLGRASPDVVYCLPIKADVVEAIIEKEHPDGILVSMGGQTALNVGIELWNSGVLHKHNVRVLGTPIEAIIATEDREVFSAKLHEIGEKLALSYSATTIQEAIDAVAKIGYPVLVRAAFALGGLGSGFAQNEEELIALAEKAFSVSSQILIDQDLRGWKEIEYEVVRDVKDNCITVCNMENFDPLGVHTGDSIVVAPSQTLSNKEYYMLRETALKVVRHIGVVGECNIQYALNPDNEEYCIVEVNARLSRSSALASKATGYPLAYVAAKLALGVDLVTIRNSVTKTTTACFEPSLDYCVIKVPRWDLKKFNKVNRTLGSAMSSVGEVMAIGRSFEEAIQKAVRMVNPMLDGLSAAVQEGIPIEEQLAKPTDSRLFAVQAALEQGMSVDDVHKYSKIDKWFLHKLNNIARMKHQARSVAFDQLTFSDLKALKCCGFSDSQIARYTSTDAATVRQRRLALGLCPWVKQIDTLAAEFPAQTNYLYMTHHGSEHDLEPDSAGVMVLGGGAYCIGSSVEFDWCAVSCVRQIRSMGHKAIVVNYNPETVSTDYDESDRLYFEELSLERVLDIYQFEQASGVIVSVGGQIPNNLALPLAAGGVNILGTSPEDIDRAEDRHKFSAMLDEIGVDQPRWKELTTIDEAALFAEEVGYPVLVRPSFVLSGAAMSVASTREQLVACLANAEEVSQDKPVVLTKFILNAKEIEVDAVANQGVVLNYAISEHVENAGVHSGDATLVLPAQKLYVQTIRVVKKIASAIAAALCITGPFNLQLLAQDNDVKVIECNLRASRSFPFVSKTFDLNFITLATKVMVKGTAKPYDIALIDIEHVCVKAPMFSFTRLRGADPTLGVEMSSTGEVACFGSDVHEAFLEAMLASNFTIPPKGAYVLVSIATGRFRDTFVESMRLLAAMGYKLCGTPGTADFYQQCGLDVIPLAKPPSNEEHSAAAWIRNKQIKLVINIPEGTTRKEEITGGYLLRRCAVDFGVSLVTNIKCAILLVEALHRGRTVAIRSIEEYHSIPTIARVGDEA